MNRRRCQRRFRLIPHQLNLNSIPILRICFLAVDSPSLLHAHAGLVGRRSVSRVGHRDGLHIHESLTILIRIPTQRPAADTALLDIVELAHHQAVSFAIRLEVSLPIFQRGNRDGVNQHPATGCALRFALKQVDRQIARNKVA